MHLHVLGVGGTFMSALALLAREAGFQVTGSDANCYPPVSTLLEAKGIVWTEGYVDTTDALRADCVVVGNAITRGMPVMEAVLDAGKPYISGPQWLAENILSRYQVIAVAGTHGKTTVTSMLAFILEQAGLNPGFLIGGVATNFETSARLGEGAWFVIEADEYDSAFFDKRPKFMHYRPECAILNNLEFDHADIYSDLAAIQQQMHYFLKTIPSKGQVLHPRDDEALNEVLARGVFSNASTMACSGSAVWRAELLDASGASFQVFYKHELVANIKWGLMGQFNIENALAALAASAHAGVKPEVAARALEQFSPVKRRLEVRMDAYGIKLYDDFAHHPTAMEKTVAAIKQRDTHARVLAIVEFASYSMRTGVHGTRPIEALREADEVYVLNREVDRADEQSKAYPKTWRVFTSVDALVQAVGAEAEAGDALLAMSNRSLEAVHQGVQAYLEKRFCR
ncbi:MAG: UDP-N-acetylmuramate:L-alanyl-gamma-D-glutamyl-meso-diaminopimelate ligase [Legionellaceae bacterium]|nr:UDP-N-acetylmuramate:L-alanyl-gamma-D-glutamyl-meso-diaminopimelate ligase [Legionellaceae bacterium]